MIRKAAVIAAFLLAAAPAAWAQDRDARFAATLLNVSAYGEVKAAPDQATITLGVDTTAPTAAAALGANAEKMTRVVAALKNAGVADKDIQTSQLSLSPQYAYEQGEAPRLTGYQASNQVTVAEPDLSRLGRLADAVVTAGATNISQIGFGLAHPIEAENAARLAAVKALQDKAALLANAAGYHIVRLVTLTEDSGETQPSPRPMMMMAAKAAAPTPVEAGELGVRVSVSGVFELAK
ncbi:MAG: SIMPL domain-containing protein [Caulobacteraceae bacterium]|jgi:uncharacterized protein YggE